MSTIELKTSLHQMIEKESNDDLLQQIKDMLHKHYNTPIDELGGQTIKEYNLEIEEAEAEIDAGEFYTHEEVVDKLNRMFSK